MTCDYSLLDGPLIRARRVAGGRPVRYSLPGLLVAMARDEVRDFPALRPHQCHPWHAFLVQLAAMALHHAGQSQLFDSEEAWKNALLALTPDHPDGCAWCLIAPDDKPAFMQAPVPGGVVKGWKDNRPIVATGWKDDRPTPDRLDILVTSKNHDLKQSRIYHAGPDDWIFALVSLQTAAPYLGSGNYGVARMNGGYSSRIGLGIDPPGGLGRRWLRDTRIALAERPRIVEQVGYRDVDGISLLWLAPWDDKSSYSFSVLDPYFIEISRRVRLVGADSRIKALRTTSKGQRITKAEADSRAGNTGDLWTPVHLAKGKALSVSGTGFNYSLMVKLLLPNITYQQPPGQIIGAEDDIEGLAILARAIAGGESATNGYHERRIPISPEIHQLFIQRKTDRLARVAQERVQVISKVSSVLWVALAALFAKKAQRKKLTEYIKDKEEVFNKPINKLIQKEFLFLKDIKDKANAFSKPFEQGEDTRFFDEMNAEVESDQPQETRLQWMLSMVERAETILKGAFDAGPRSGEQRYRARAAALASFHGRLRSDKVLPTLAAYYRQQKANHQQRNNKEITPNVAP